MRPARRAGRAVLGRDRPARHGASARRGSLPRRCRRRRRSSSSRARPRTVALPVTWIDSADSLTSWPSRIMRETVAVGKPCAQVLAPSTAGAAIAVRERAAGRSSSPRPCPWASWASWASWRLLPPPGWPAADAPPPAPAPLQRRARLLVGKRSGGGRRGSDARRQARFARAMGGVLGCAPAGGALRGSAGGVSGGRRSAGWRRGWSEVGALVGLVVAAERECCAAKWRVARDWECARAGAGV
jgi:hypothetical protein